MSKNPSADQKEVRFYFSRSKGSHEEAGEFFVTLLARLSVEVFYAGDTGDKGEHKTIWVDIEEMRSIRLLRRLKKCRIRSIGMKSPKNCSGTYLKFPKDVQRSFTA